MPAFDIGLVQRPNGCQMAAQRRREAIREYGDTILGTLAVAHGDFATREIDVLHPQPSRLQDSHAGTVQEPTE